MSLKAELIKWSQALDSYDAQDFTSALEHFEAIADSSKVLFNIGLIHATLGGHATAVAYYKQAHLLDQYMAVSFFQCGVSQFLMRNYTEAYGDFDSALGHMRENQIIDYDQLGLKFKLYSAEILFNMGLCMLNMNHQGDGMSFLDRARREKQIPEHDIIDEAFSSPSSSSSKNYTVFSLPVGALFRPSPIKLKNLKSKNYLGSAKLVAATEVTDAFTGFSGVGAKRDRADTGSSTASAPRERKRDGEEGTIQPLSFNKSKLPALPSNQINPLRTQKSVPDLRKRAGSTSATEHQRVPSKPQQLPRLDTMNVPRPVVQPTHLAGGRTANPSKGSGGGGAIQAMLNGLPTPPDSPPRTYGMQYKDPARKRVSSMTQLDYAKPNGNGNSRETKMMEELIDGYSERGDGMDISPYPGRQQTGGYKGVQYPSPNVEGLPKQRKNSAPNILLDMHHQAPQGQSPERVADWAAQQKNHSSNRSPQNDLLRPYQFPSSANSSNSGRNMNMNNGNGNLDTLRSGSGTLRLRRQNTKASTGSRQMSGSDYDEMMSARTLDMVSFRLKLHFEDEIRGMSIDADTSFDIFFAKLQAKFGLSDMKLKYKDEDGSLVTIVDETDWDSAVDAAREHCPTGRQDGKLEIWVSEV